MQNRLKFTGLALSFALVISAAGLILVPSKTYANPLDYFAASPQAGSGCTLPDGSQGTIQGDGHTCCPAQDQTTSSDNSTTQGQKDISCLVYKYVNPALGLLTAAVGIVVIIGIIVGGIEFTSSGGDPQRVASGRRHIMNALLGLLAYLLLYAFLQFLLPGGIFNG